MSMNFKADPGGTSGIIQINGVDKLSVNADGSIVALDPVAPGDTTVGRLLQVGDFGVGNPIIVATGSCNGLKTAGTYYLFQAVTDMPENFFSYLEVIVSDLPEEYVIQRLMVVGSTPTTYERQLSGGTWTPWVKIIREGDFGLGRICTASIIDFNTYPDSVGVKGHLPYVVSEDGSTNGPPNGGSYFFVQHFFYINGNCVQIAWPYYSNQSMWIRKRFNGVWTPWVQQYDQQNILGTVSQSAGVPTGAIIETGSNANGEYVKFADGTMICNNKGLAITNTITTAEGSLFRTSDNLSWTYPSEFIDAPVVAGGSGITTRWVGLSDPTSSSILFKVYGPVSDSTPRNADLMAIGRWF